MKYAVSINLHQLSSISELELASRVLNCVTYNRKKSEIKSFLLIMKALSEDFFLKTSEGS